MISLSPLYSIPIASYHYFWHLFYFQAIIFISKSHILLLIRLFQIYFYLKHFLACLCRFTSNLSWLTLCLNILNRIEVYLFYSFTVKLPDRAWEERWCGLMYCLALNISARHYLFYIWQFRLKVVELLVRTRRFFSGFSRFPST